MLGIAPMLSMRKLRLREKWFPEEAELGFEPRLVWLDIPGCLSLRL